MFHEEQCPNHGSSHTQEETKGSANLTSIKSDDLGKSRADGPELAPRHVGVSPRSVPVPRCHPGNSPLSRFETTDPKLHIGGKTRKVR